MPKIRLFDSYDLLSQATAEFIAGEIRKKPDSLICLPSGDSPTGTLRQLCELERKGVVDFSSCKFVGLDEWVGMDHNDEGSCQSYLYKTFFDHVAVRPDQIVFFNAKAKDLDAECQRITRSIKENGAIDLALLGVGTNGHLGLNEPGVSPSLDAHVVALTQETITGAQKYFTTARELQYGVTIGLRQLMKARKVVLIANGKKKAQIIHRILEGTVTEEIPGTILQKHPDCYFLLEKEAAAQLSVS